MLNRGGLAAEHELFQFHFHWGFDSDDGSEHSVNGRKFPLEVRKSLGNYCCILWSNQMSK